MQRITNNNPDKVSSKHRLIYHLFPITSFPSAVFLHRLNPSLPKCGDTQGLNAITGTLSGRVHFPKNTAEAHGFPSSRLYLVLVNLVSRAFSPGEEFPFLNFALLPFRSSTSLFIFSFFLYFSYFFSFSSLLFFSSLFFLFPSSLFILLFFFSLITILFSFLLFIFLFSFSFLVGISLYFF